MKTQTAIQLRSSKLIMVSPQNNNKFYHMQENCEGNFTASYGRVGTIGTSRIYPINQWETKYREKIRKGYSDQTALFINEKKEQKIIGIEDDTVKYLIESLIQFAKKSIAIHYNVSAEKVTTQQVEKAQEIIDILSKKIKKKVNIDPLNQQLIELYKIIPRKMNQVSEFLIEELKTKEDLINTKRLIEEEQATLDVMRGQVSLNQDNEDLKEINILEKMGLFIEKVKDQNTEKMLKNMMKDHKNKFYAAYKVTNYRTQKSFDQYKTQNKTKGLKNIISNDTELFWHGSRNENWLSILESGLILRPSAVITGKMFGYGLYFADKFQKSLNYSSIKGSYWSNGNSNKAFLAVYDVFTGSKFKIKHHKNWCYDLDEEKLKAKGNYHSLFAKGGADLINNEYIIYNENQCTIKYLVEIRN